MLTARCPLYYKFASAKFETGVILAREIVLHFMRHSPVASLWPLPHSISPTTFARQTSRQRRLCLRSNRGGLFVSQCTVWPLHHQSGETSKLTPNTPMVRATSLSPEPHRPKGRSCPLEPRPLHGDQSVFRAPLETHDQPYAGWMRTMVFAHGDENIKLILDPATSSQLNK